MAHGSTYDLWLITAITGGRGAAAAAAARVARASAARFVQLRSACSIRRRAAPRDIGARGRHPRGAAGAALAPPRPCRQGLAPAVA
jgi:hypothetical protein